MDRQPGAAQDRRHPWEPGIPHTSTGVLVDTSLRGRVGLWERSKEWGGSIAEPEHAEYVLARAKHCDGFYGASSMERLPVESALAAQVAKFKAIKKVQRN